METKDVSKLRYENLINYRICEIMYMEMKQTKYNTFANLCANMRDSLNANGRLGGAQAKLLNNTLSSVIELYGIEYIDSVKYVSNFLNNNLWERYYEIVVTFYTKTKTSFQ